MILTTNAYWKACDLPIITVPGGRASEAASTHTPRKIRVNARSRTEDGPFADDTVTNTYNNRLRVNLALQQPTGVWTNAFGCDAAKRLTSVTSPAGAFSYQLPNTQPSTLIQKLTLPNTSYITNEFDSNARLLSTTLKKNDGTILNSHAYSYNPGNQRTQQVFNVGSTYNYTYDPIGQLKVADSATASEDRGYTYDTAWNLNYRTNNGTLNTFSVDGLNQLTNSTPGGVSMYDGNGNLISSGGTALECAYDDENRLSLVRSNLVVYGTNYPFWQVLYYYDGKSRLRLRVEMQVLAVPEEPPQTDLFGGQESLQSGGGGGHPWGTNSITEYIYDGWRVIQERDGSNVPTVSYTRGTDLSGSLEGAGGIGGLLARSHGYNSGNWTNHNCYHADGNGNVTYLVTASQAQAARYRYDPYGNMISSSETLGYLGTPNTYRFSSKMADLKHGLYYYGFRWYEPNFQRWLNQDPFDETGFQRVRKFVGKRGIVREGENPYLFVVNNSISNIDPLGLLTFDGSCPKEARDKIEQGFKEGCDAAKAKGCFKLCGGLKSEGEKKCNDGAAGITFSCGNYSSENREEACGSMAAGKCGETSADYKTITICPPIFSTGVDSKQCEGAKCVIIHELTHAVGGTAYNHPNTTAYQVEECTGCKGRDYKPPTQVLPQPEPIK